MVLDDGIARASPVDGKEFRVAFPLEAGAVSCAMAAVSDCFVNVFGCMWSVELASHVIVHAMLARRVHQFRVMDEVKEVWTKQLGTMVFKVPPSRVMVCPYRDHTITWASIPTMAATSQQTVSLACSANNSVSVDGVVFVSSFENTTNHAAGNLSETKLDPLSS